MSIRIRTYICTVKHDDGVLDIAVGASSKEVACTMIMNFEHCPRRAIKAVRWAR